MGSTLYLSSLFGGGIAGMFVDVILFPLDTLKTRLQSQQGFLKAGGFKSVYKGLGPQAVGSAPQAALFFLTYETFKELASPHVSPYFEPVVHMTGASLAEVVACVIRVPIEVVKQRRQTTLVSKSSINIMLEAVRSEGVLKGLYRGFGSTVLREVPFSLIQFPILELLKKKYASHFNDNVELASRQVAICGAIAGGTSAAITTPLDVVKTRIMLADKQLAGTGQLTVKNMFKVVYNEKGVQGLFAGFAPRVLWITLGGYIFFGMYDFSKNFCAKYLNELDEVPIRV